MEENVNEVAEVEEVTGDTQDQNGQASIDVEQLIDNPEFKKFMESYADKRVTDAVKTTTKKLKATYEKEKKEAEMSQEEILQQKEKELYERELKLEKIAYFKEKDYALDLLDYVDGETIVDIQEKADGLQSVLEQVIEKAVNERLKGGYVPPKSTSKGTKEESIGLKLAKQVSGRQKSTEEQQQVYFK